VAPKTFIEKRRYLTMKCPHCEKEIPGSTCPECGTTVPDGAKYCMECGFSLGQKVDEKIDSDDGFDFKNRVLCPDGTCTGIIINGKCTECGKKVPG
jgi:endogenous inhibitor of DNA gyrase (YacG/DUF329 family)